MNALGRAILADLETVGMLRAERAADAVHGAAVEALKRWQSRRFSLTYADLLASPRYQAAARFFLGELYGPGDYSLRDAQFARIVPAMVRLMPGSVVDTVAVLARLHALSERLDTDMAHALEGKAPSPPSYAQAWCAVGLPHERERQVQLTLEIGRALDRFTRNPLLRRTLHLMRGPAAAAGLGSLQAFLETGFDTFAAMKGADDFLHTVAQRERALCAALFACDGRPDAALQARLPPAEASAGIDNPAP